MHNCLKVIFILTFLLIQFFDLTAHSGEPAGNKIKVEQIQFSRILPYTYCDQGKSSIAGIFTDSELITFHRLGYLSKRPYCLIAYRENNIIDKIVISGVFLLGTNAYRFETTTSRKDYGITLLKLAEMITKYDNQN